MADTEKRKSVGDRYNMTAATYNGLMDMLAWFNRHKGNVGVNGFSDLIESSLKAFVRNDSGEPLPRSFYVLNLYTPLLDLGSHTLGNSIRHAFKGDTPVTNGDFIGIVQAPLADTKIARCVFRGLTLARVKINDELHEWAKPVADEREYLESAETGIARILSTFEDTDGSGSGSVEGSTTSGPPVMMALIDLIQSNATSEAVAASLEVANVTESTGVASGDGRVLDAGNWVDNGTTYSNEIIPVQVSSTDFALTPDATVILFSSGGETAGIPLQYAGRIGSDYYGGFISTGNQEWIGDKELSGTFTSINLTVTALGSVGNLTAGILTVTTSTNTNTLSVTTVATIAELRPALTLIGGTVQIPGTHGATLQVLGTGSTIGILSNQMIMAQNGGLTYPNNYRVAMGGDLSNGTNINIVGAGLVAYGLPFPSAPSWLVYQGGAWNIWGTTNSDDLSLWTVGDIRVGGEWPVTPGNFPSGVSPGKYWCGIDPGLTGTLGPGAAAAGGIIIDLGAGSYATVPPGALTGTYNASGTY